MEFTVSRTLTITDENVADIYETACYGSIDYWCNEASIDTENRTMTFIEDDQDNTEHMITYERLAETVARLYQDDTIIADYIREYITDSFDKSDVEGMDLCYIDAEAADCIVQLAIFNKLVYA